MMWIAFNIKAISILVQIQAVLSLNVQLIREKEECLHAINVIRYRHRVSNLSWDETLSRQAESWALYLAAVNKGLMHSSFVDKNGNKYGETLYYQTGSGNCVDALYLWYKEVDNYNFQSPARTSNTGHFIQLVWSKAMSFGVGIAFSNQKTWIVARYRPSQIGSLRDHVFPLRSGISAPTQKDLKLSSNPERVTINLNVKHGNTLTPCMDLNKHCNYWLNIAGYKCDDPRYTIPRACPKSCGVCKTTAGGWSHYQKVTKCSTATGTYMVERFCIDPLPSADGKDCVGDYKIAVACHGQNC